MNELQIYQSDNGALELSATVKDESVWLTQQQMAEHGQKYKTQIYNLDAIISVGYRVNSKKAT